MERQPAKTSGLLRPERAVTLPRKLAAPAFLVLFVALLGLLPHLYLTVRVDDLTFFKGAYDEDTYYLFMLRGVYDIYRAISHFSIRFLYEITGFSSDLTLIAADVILPAIIAAASYYLAAQLASDWRIRLLLASIVIFSQDILSVSNLSVWEPGNILAEQFRGLLASWGPTLVPDSTTSYVTLFRTPEPQIAYCIEIAIIGLLIRLGSRDVGLRSGEWAALAGLSVMLPFTYVFVALPTLMLEMTMVPALLLCRHRDAAIRLALIAACTVAIFVGAAFASRASEDVLFASRLPVVTPAILASVLLLLLGSAGVIYWRRGDVIAWMGLCLLAVPVFLSNQQVLTGYMFSARDWERNVNYQFLALSCALGARTMLVGMASSTSGLFAKASVFGALLLAFVVTTAHARSVRFWLGSNLSSVAMARAAQSAEPPLPPGTRIFLDEPALSPLVRVRTGDRFALGLDYTDVFLARIARMDASGAAPASPHAQALFEHWWRVGTDTDTAEAILTEEAARRSGFYLGFLFNMVDYWYPATDNRAVREAEVKRNIPEIVARYGAYLRSRPARTDAPEAVLLSRLAPEAVKAPIGLSNTLIGIGTADTVTIYAYRQAAVR